LVVNLDRHVNNLQEKVKEIEENTEALAGLRSYHLSEEAEHVAKCSGTNNQTKLILGSCYFFENSQKTFSSAKDFCRTAFGQDALGKLFEPTDLQTFQNVNETANSMLEIVSNNHPWIGFERVGSVWKHVSNNAISAQIHPWPTTFDDSAKEKYLHFYTNQDKWDVQFTDTNPFVCELVIS